MLLPLSNFLQKTSGLALLLLSALLAYQLALLSWSFFPEVTPNYRWIAPTEKVQQGDHKIDTKKLQQQHLFGQQIKAKKVQRKAPALSDLPKTKLNLTLVGVVAATEPVFSSAIIEYQGRQESYFIGSVIEGTNANVSEIYEDRIIIDVNGESQTLMLDGIEQLNKQRETHEFQSQLSNSENITNEQVHMVDLDREALLKDPGKLSDYVHISPVRENNEVKGYRVKPGKDRGLFDQSGLKDNDLAVELNGIDLTDTQQAFTLMKEFPTMTEMSLTVERDGQLYELYFSIP
ncbi:MAG: general secretion pathway protein C [Psychromonas sp.]|jgi:general secretion pathway protein C|uniref:type II secretion system protein GspC n=1 Tax=Psychromonas sp. TaxID=1884585 RepID=UPI0039E4709A